MFSSEGLRTTARDLTIKARAAESNEEKLALASRAKSYLLLAKNAEWLASTDEFLRAIEMERAGRIRPREWVKRFRRLWI